MSTVGSEPVAGRYTLVREVGRGGMGAVWLARDELLGRDVALKRLGEVNPADTTALARAEREAQLAARLTHPNVVTVFDLAVDGEVRWLVMEYVEGRTLAQLARERGGLPPDQVAVVIGQAAEALREAHAAGIVHRDVKPSNLIVGNDGVTKLTDFGIARGVTDATLTGTGVVTGSPAYLAPEVAAGGSATPASDLWSLGGTVYQALTGRPPYDFGDNVVAGLLTIVRTPPPRLPDAGVLGTVIAATMVHDPAQRWTAEQVCAYLGGEPATALPPVPAATAGMAIDHADPVGERTPQLTTQRVVRTSRPPLRRGLWLWPALGVLLVAALLAAWLLDRTLSSPDEASDPGTSAPPPPATSSPTTSGPSAESIRAFVTDYLATVTRDPEAAFARLTPQFQEESGGFDDYRAFWAPIRSATPSEIDADPEAMTVSYRVDYDGPNNRPDDDRVRLQLVWENGRYLIAGEPK